MHKTNLTWFDGLSVFRFNRIRNHREWFDRRQESWALNYAHRGSLVLSVDNGPRVVLQAPIAYWTWPGPQWTYGPADSDGWEHVFVSWLGPRPRQWARSGLLPCKCTKRARQVITDPDAFSHAFDALHQLLVDAPPNDPAVVHHSEGLLLQLHRQTPRMSTSSVSDGVRGRIAAMRQAPGDPWDFALEAERLGCTPVHLRRVWKAQTGLPPAAWLQKTRLDQAATLLRTTGLTVAIIAGRVGYDNMSLFSRQFRRAKDLPPGRYRQAYRSVD